MAEQLPERPSDGHPIAAGFAALVGVALVIGLILGLVVLAGTKVLGLGDESQSTTPDSERSMYLPTPEKTAEAGEPEITLGSGSSAKPAEPGANGSSKPKETKAPEKAITLSASATSVGPMQQFDLTGTYPGGEGAILQVQRASGNQWLDFPATASVSGETFKIPVQTSQPGVNRLRVVDTDSGRGSNVVKVTIG